MMIFLTKKVKIDVMNHLNIAFAKLILTPPNISKKISNCMLDLYTHPSVNV